MSFKNHGNRQPQHAGMTASPQIQQMKIDYGHDGKRHVVIAFSQNVRNLLLTPAQADEMIEAIQNAKKAMAEFKKEPTGG